MRICVLVFTLAATSAVAGESLPDTRLSALPKSAALSQDTPEKVKLGRLLFFDPILSATQGVACATCHHPRFGWADGRVTPLGVQAIGLGPERKPLETMEAVTLTRNTPSILNAAFNGLRLDQPHEPAKAPMFWDNRVESLEAQVLAPIRSREEMRGDGCSEAEAVPQMIERLRGVPEYVRLFGGKITVETARPLSPQAAYELLQSSLRLQGFAIVETGSISRVVPEADAKLQSGPVNAGRSPTAGGEQIVTQVFRMVYESASNLVPVLRPLIAPNNTIVAYPNNNSLVITDYASNLQRLARIIATLDSPVAGEVEVVA